MIKKINLMEIGVHRCRYNHKDENQTTERKMVKTVLEIDDKALYEFVHRAAWATGRACSTWGGAVRIVVSSETETTKVVEPLEEKEEE